MSKLDAYDLPTPIYQPRGWTEHAACKGKGDLFFISRGGNSSTQVRAAKAICAECPVLDQCREYALNDASLEGVWAGMNDRERKKARRLGRGVLVRCRHCLGTFHARNSKASICEDCAARGHLSGNEHCGQCGRESEDWLTHSMRSTVVGRRR